MQCCSKRLLKPLLNRANRFDDMRSVRFEPDRGKPWHFKYLTVNHIYYPLAQSRGKIFALLKAHTGENHYADGTNGDQVSGFRHRRLS